MSVLIETSLGDLVIDLETERCPRTCENFLKLCKVKYYNLNAFFNGELRSMRLLSWIIPDVTMARSSLQGLHRSDRRPDGDGNGWGIVCIAPLQVASTFRPQPTA
jgi:peptidyl-prolyl cis-trans isomerase-like 4